MCVHRFFLRIYNYVGTRASFAHSCYATLVPMAYYIAAMDHIQVRFAIPACLPVTVLRIHYTVDNNILTYE